MHHGSCCGCGAGFNAFYAAESLWRPVVLTFLNQKEMVS